MNESDSIAAIVGTTSSLIKQRLDEFMRSARGWPTDVRIEAIESVARHVMLSIKSLQYEAEQLKGQAEK